MKQVTSKEIHGDRNAAHLIAKSFLELPTADEMCRSTQIAFELGTKKIHRQHVAYVVAEGAYCAPSDDAGCRLVENTQYPPDSIHCCGYF